MNRRVLTAVLTGFVLGLGSCKEGPKAGEIEVVLATPNSDDGAVQFTATTTPPYAITAASAACAGCKLFLVKLNDTQYRGVVTGNVVAGPLMRLSVPDTRAKASYTIQLNSIATRTFAVRSINGYSTSLR